MITILTAHHGEAKPFIDHYRLQAEPGQGLGLFVNPPVRLLVMGQGRRHAEKSLFKLVTSMEAPAQHWWINFGLGGSSRFPPGTLVAIDQVGERDGNRLLSIDCGRIPGLPVSCCLSQDQPATNYPERGVVDMEAAAVVNILQGIDAVARLGMFKLISDGPGLPADALTPAMARARVERHANEICRATDDFIDCHIPRDVCDTWGMVESPDTANEIVTDRG